MTLPSLIGHRPTGNPHVTGPQRPLAQEWHESGPWSLFLRAAELDDWIASNEEAIHVGSLFHRSRRSKAPETQHPAIPQRVSREPKPPDVSKLKAESNIRELLKALEYEMDKDIRGDAAMALGDLGCQEAVEALVTRLRDDDEDYVKRAAARALRTLSWAPTNHGQAAAWYWRFAGDLEKCAACGQEALAPLLPAVLEGTYDADDAYVSIGEPAFEVLTVATTALYKQWEAIISNTAGLDFRSVDDRQRAAIIEAVTDRLGHAVYAVGKFRSPMSETFLAELYDIVRQNIYSHRESGFLDMYRAVAVRTKIISAFRGTTKARRGEPIPIGADGVKVVIDALRNDEAAAVRWEAADDVQYMAKVSPTTVRSSNVKEALAKLVSDMKDPNHPDAQNLGGISGESRLSRYVELLADIEAA